ncbi:hypothetical protein JCM10207_007019 [Rhodosporidiobolus poonsookiae]
MASCSAVRSAASWRRPAVVQRWFSSSAASSTSSTSQGLGSTHPRGHPHWTLYLRVLRTAARGVYELSAAAATSPPSSRYIAQQKYRPTPTRRTPPSGSQAGVSFLGGAAKKRRERGALVQVDAARLLGPGGRRGFSSSAVASRVAEESLADAGEYGYEVGGWEDVEGSAGAAGEIGARGSLNAGDFVETYRSGVSLSGVYLSRSPITPQRGVILTTGGIQTEVSHDNITFTVPSFVDANQAASLAPSPDTYSQDAPFDASQPVVLEIIQALRRLELAVESETQQLVARGSSNLYRTLLDTLPPPGSPEALGKRKIFPVTHTTPRSALRALQLSVTPLRPRAVREERLLAMHRVLMRQPAHFVADQLAIRSTGRFDLRPRDEVERYEKVRDWVRYRAGELSTWATKAARAREWGRKSVGEARSESAQPVKLPVDDPTLRWTDDDLAIFAFLRDTLAVDRIIQDLPHMTLAPTLVKLVDEAAAGLGYVGWGGGREVKKGRLRSFLAEVGVVAPWENWTAHEQSAGLKEWDERGQMVDDALRRALGCRKSAAQKRTAGLASTDFYPSDPHDAVRHDFGAVKVYTIDDAGASELDDGISISAAPPSSSGRPTHWVHVHVADPTALLHPAHLLAKLARVRDHTEYFPEKTWPMLAESFTNGQRLSLGSMGGAEQRVLSMGMRIEEETGEVVESEVKAGVIRNVMRLTYGAVDQALGYVAPLKGSSITLGSLPAGQKKSMGRFTDDARLNADADALVELRLLHGLAARLLKRRVDSTAVAWTFPRASVAVSYATEPHFHTSSRSSFYSGTPRIELHLPSPAALDGTAAFTDSPASLLVSEMMVAANRAAAKFAGERSLEVPFRQQGPPLSSPDRVAAVLALRNPANGFVPGREVLKRGLEFAAGTTAATPGSHWPMGINDPYGYVQVTSPLRRYSDLFSHYQLKSALLPSTSRSSVFAPAFQGAAVAAHLDGFNAARKARYRLGEAAEAFWALWLVKQKLDLLRAVSSSTSSTRSCELSDADQHAVDLLANGLTALAIRAPAHSAFDNVYVQRVLIPQLGLRGTLHVNKADAAPPVGEEVPVQIEEIVLSARSTLAVSLRR